MCTGVDATVAKFHYALHLSGFLRRFGKLPSGLLHERKHRVARRYLNDRRNALGDIGNGALRGITVHHLEYLHGEARLSSDLAKLGPRSPDGRPWSGCACPSAWADLMF